MCDFAKTNSLASGTKATWTMVSGLLLLMAFAPGADADVFIFEEDFDGATWTSIANPAANTHANIGNDVDLRGPSLTNGWNFLNAGVGPFGDDVNLVNNTSANGNFSYDNTGSLTLGLKNWTHFYREVDLSQVANDTVSLSFDYYYPGNGDNNPDLFYGIFDDAPTNDDRNIWETSSAYLTHTPANPLEKGTITLTDFDTSGFSGSLFVGFQKQGFGATVGIDNVRLTTTPEPASIFLWSAIGLSLLIFWGVRKRRERSTAGA